MSELSANRNWISLVWRLTVAACMIMLLYGHNVVSEAAAAELSPVYRLKTFAGSNDTNGIPAIYSGLGDMTAMAWKNGDLYVAVGPLIKKIDKSGNIYTIGGNPRGSVNIGYIGDSILATTALFSYVTSLGIDPSNEYVYLTDYEARMIRRISLKSNLVSGVYFLTDYDSKLIQILNKNELIFSMRDSETYVGSVRKLDIRTSNDTYFMNFPRLSDTGKYINNTIYSIDLEYSKCYKTYQNGSYETLFPVSGGVNPAIEVDSKGNVFYASRSQIFKFNTTGQKETIAGQITSGFSGDGGPAVLSTTTEPSSFVLNDEGELMFVDRYNSRIRKIDKQGLISTIAGSSPTPSVQALPPKWRTFNRIDSVAYHSDGRFIYDNGDYAAGYRVQHLSNNGAISSTAINEKVSGMAADSSGSTLYYTVLAENLVKKYNNTHVVKIAGDGLTNNIVDGVPGVQSSVPSPNGICLYNNDLYVASQTRIRVIYQNGTIGTVFGGTENIRTVFVASGTIYYIGDSTNAIYQVLSISTSLQIIGGGTNTNDTVQPATMAKLENPQSFFVSTNLDMVVIGEENRIRISTVNGSSITTLFFVEEGLETQPLSSISSPKSIHVNESGALEITFASKGNIFTLVREMNDTCFGVKVDNDKVCSGRGICTKYNLCQCSSGYGPNCELNVCSGIFSNDPRSCSGRGQCQADGSCLCENGFKGVRCELRNISCFGVVAEQVSVCSGNGACTDQDVCSCSEGYYGASCANTSCFGIPHNSPLVCSNGNGICTAPDNCVCNGGFSGDYCNVTYCNDLPNSDPDVCNSRGLCIASDVCRCNAGYVGRYCEDHTCFGIVQSNTSVCSGYGECYDLDSCACSEGRAGARCELDTCFGVASNSPQVCNNGNGSCIALDVCSCKSGWIGLDCSTPFCLGSYSKQIFSCVAPQQDQNTEIIIESGIDVKDLDSRYVNFTKFDGSLLIKLSSSLSTYLNETNQITNSDISIIAAAFSPPSSEKVEQVISSVVTLSLVNSDNKVLKISQLKEPIQIVFGKVLIPKQNMTDFNLTCAFFDSSTTTWSIEGLATIVENTNDDKLIDGVLHITQYITCHSNHLTSFAVIDQNYKRANGEYKGPAEASQLRRDMVSLTNEQVIIIATTVGGSCVILLTVAVLIIVVVVMVTRKKKLDPESKSARCCCC